MSKNDAKYRDDDKTVEYEGTIASRAASSRGDYYNLADVVAAQRKAGLVYLLEKSALDDLGEFKSPKYIQLWVTSDARLLRSSGWDRDRAVLIG